ncbi:hypothetical protein [Kitasatospora purpeofusca]|uniref:hypothetical protein n=1 Tax=Kitasatospora purpeofusca TaxID=67352 RepID=UPI003669A76B
MTGLRVEAGTAALTMAAAVEGAAELAVLAEAAAVVETAASPSPKPPPFTATPGMPPLPHDPTGRNRRYAFLQASRCCAGTG